MLHGVPRSCSEMLGAARKSLGAARSCSALLGAPRNYSETLYAYSFVPVQGLLPLLDNFKLHFLL